MNRTVLTSFVTFCLLSPVFLVGLALNIETVKASGTINIGADGSVDPPTAPIQRVGDFYTLTDNVFSDTDGIVIERNDMTLDGNGYTVHGTGIGAGIDLAGRNNVIIKNAKITQFGHGIELSYSSNNTLSKNNITNNNMGVSVYCSSNNSVYENNIKENRYWEGVWLYNSSNNCISGNNITNNYRGFLLSWSSNNTISGNNIANNDFAVELYCSSYNTISRNMMNNNAYAFYIWGYVDTSRNNKVYHNNFIDNTQQVYIVSTGHPNIWDGGYPSCGNYWSDYLGVDLDHDGVGDTPYSIDADNEDKYPLMGMLSVLNATKERFVNIISNSTISNFSLGVDYNGLNNTISFKVTGANGTTGFCRITIPRGLLEGPYAVLVNGEVASVTELPISNSTHAFLYFTYVHSTHTVIIFSWEHLLGRYIELLADYQSLNSTYYELLDAYDELLADYNSLNSTYHALLFSHMELLGDYNSLQTNYTNLQSDYNLLNSALNDLQEDYDTLDSLYNTLNATYNELKSEQEAAFSELYTIQDLMYVFIATTIILTVTTIYFATRKPKTRPLR